MVLENLNKSTSDEVVHALLDEKRKTKNLEIKIQQLEEQLSRFSHKFNSGSINEFNDLQESYKKLKHQYQLTIVALTESQEESKALRGQQKTLKEIIDKVKKENQFLQERLSETENQITILTKHLQTYKNESINQEEMQKRLQHYEEKDSQQLEKLIELYNKEKKASLEIDQLRAQLDENNKNSEREKQNLKQAITENEKKSAFELDHLKAQFNEKEKILLQEIENLRIQIDIENKLAAEVDHLSSQLRDKDKVLNECESLKEQLKESEIKNEEVFHQILNLKQKNSNLELTNSELQKSNSDSIQHCEQLERVIQFLREKNEESQNENKQLESELAISQEKITSLKDELALNEEAMSEVSKKLASETEKLTNAQHHSSYLEDKFNNLENQLIQKNEELLRQQEFNNHLQKELDLQIKLHEENKEVINFLEKRIEEIDVQIHQMTEEKNDFIEIIDNHKITIQDLKTTLQTNEASYQSEIVQLKDHIKSLQEQKSDLEKDSNEKINDLTTGIQDLLTEKGNLERLNHDYKLKIDQYHIEKEELVDEINIKSKTVEDLQKTKEDLSEIINSSNLKIDEIQEEKNALCEQLILLKKVVEEERTKFGKTESSLEELQKSQSFLTKELELKIKENEELNLNLKELKGFYHTKESSLQNEISLMKMEILEYKDKELKHRNDFNSQEMQLQETKQVLNVVTLQKDRIEEMYNQLRTDYERIQDIIDVLRKEKEYIKRELLERDEDKNSLIVKIKELNSYISNIEKDFLEQKEKLIATQEKLEKTSDMYHKEIEKFQNENIKTNDLLLKLEEKQTNFDKLLCDNKKYESRICEYEKKENQLNNDKETLTKEIHTLFQKYHHLEEEKEAALLKLESIEKEKAELISIKNKYEKEQEISQKEIKTFQNDILELNQKYIEKENEIYNLTHKLDEITSSKAHLERKYEEINAFSKQNEMTLEDLKREHQSIHNEKTRLENEKNKLESEIAQWKRKADESESKAQIAQQHLAKKVKETALLSEELDKKGKKNGELQQILTSTQHQINESRKNAETYLQEKRRLEDKIKELSAKMDSEKENWERKYGQVYKQLQDSYLENQKLLKQKNKLDQMQSILNNLSNVMNIPQVNEKISYESSLNNEVPTKIQFKEEIFQKVQENEKAEEPSFLANSLDVKLDFSAENHELNEELAVSSNSSEEKHYQNLFDFNSHQSRYKKTFFDQ